MSSKNTPKSSGCATFIFYIICIGVVIGLIGVVLEFLAAHYIAVFAVMATLLACAMAVVVLKAKKKHQQQEEEKAQREQQIQTEWLQKCITDYNVFYQLAEEAVSTEIFIDFWKKAEEKLDELLVFNDEYGTISGFYPSAKKHSMQFDFQWKLRNAIEREKDTAIEKIRHTYTNSIEHKEREYRVFCMNLDGVCNLFSEETKRFADAAIESVYVASGSTEIRHTPFSSSQAANPSSSVESEFQKIDAMDGHTFEYWCADLLKKAGFTDVEVTKGSGDQGVDILASKDGIQYAVQCKCYASDLGNKPVQEVHAGKSFYHCQVGAVMTNRYFTEGARNLANATGVLLWDREWITSALKKP